jgi:transmembrane sensor
MAVGAAGFAVLAGGERGDRDADGAGVAGGREIVTARGQRATVELRDGSHVTLGADSRLSIPADFGEATRTVTLDGEAYFDVVHDARRPFDVRTGFAVTRVLGTRFGVRGESDVESVDVVVASGKVALRRLDDSTTAVVLTDGQRARIGPSGAAEIDREVAADRWLAWTTGELVFDRTPLSEVVRTLERWYDVRVVLDDSTIAVRRATAIVRSDQSPGDVVRAIALSLHLEARQEGPLVYRLRRGG